MAFGTERDSQLARLLDELRADDTAADELPEDAPTEPTGDGRVVGPPDGASGGRYRLIRKLGEGGMGEVYEGYDPQLDRPVAIKFPLFDPRHPQHANRVRRFLREAHAAARVRHGNVCPIYDVGEADGRPFVVMALVRGESLAARLTARGGPFGPAEAVRIVR